DRTRSVRGGRIDHHRRRSSWRSRDWAGPPGNQERLVQRPEEERSILTASTHRTVGAIGWETANTEVGSAWGAASARRTLCVGYSATSAIKTQCPWSWADSGRWSIGAMTPPALPS